EEAQRGPLEHLAVDRADLVRERLYVARRDGEHRVEEAGEGDALCLGGEAELVGVRSEGAGGVRCQLEVRFRVAVEAPLSEPGGRPVDDVQRIGSVPRHGDDLNRLSRYDPGQVRARRDVFELHPRLHTSSGSTICVLTDTPPQPRPLGEANSCQAMPPT